MTIWNLLPGTDPTTESAEARWHGRSIERHATHLARRLLDAGRISKADVGDAERSLLRALQDVEAEALGFEPRRRG